MVTLGKMLTWYLTQSVNKGDHYLEFEDLLCENSTCHKNKAVSKNQTSATFLMLGKNPRMTSGKITFLRDSCGDFFLASKM